MKHSNFYLEGNDWNWYEKCIFRYIQQHLLILLTLDFEWTESKIDYVIG